MAPLIPRFHLWEIDDQPWFPAQFRSWVQASLTQAWIFVVPFLQKSSAAAVVAKVLEKTLGASIFDYTFIDFCAGGGGPTPFVEKILNQTLAAAAATSGEASGSSAESSQSDGKPGPVQFILTDLHPHVENWRQAAAQSPNIRYEAESVDATHAPRGLIERVRAGGHKVFRLFNLAFHHFDDPLAREILKDTLETSDGFGIFELQHRDLSSVITFFIFGAGILIAAPYYAWLWGAPTALFWVYVIPVIPFVLVFDGFISALRTRTPDEVEHLLRTCGADRGSVAEWEIRSGKVLFLQPFGYLHWIVGLKKQSGKAPAARKAGQRKTAQRN